MFFKLCLLGFYDLGCAIEQFLAPFWDFGLAAADLGIVIFGVSWKSVGVGSDLDCRFYWFCKAV